MVQASYPRIAIRLTGALVYLGGAVAWMLVSYVADVLRCDDNCLAPEYWSGWQDNPNAWQWEWVVPLALAGAVLAAMAVVAGWFNRSLGIGLLGVHATLFVENVVFLISGADDSARLDSEFVVPVLLVAAAGAVAVGLRTRSLGGHGAASAQR